ncbi:hypothetical protein ACFSHQ_00825 [Gemmobacter lanyuensis]
MFLSQIQTETGDRAVVARDGQAAHIVPGVTRVIDLAKAAIAAGRTLAQEVTARGTGPAVDLAAALAEGRVLLPVDHPDPAHLHLTGTGLTHLGSAATRNSMHAKADPEQMTDSMKMFRMGLEGGKPAPVASGHSLNGSTRATVMWRRRRASRCFRRASRWMPGKNLKSQGFT